MAVGNQTQPGAAPRPAVVSDERIVELVDTRRLDSLRYNRGVFSKLQSYYDVYRGIQQGNLGQFRNNISIPFTFAMIQSDVARKVQTCFGQWPIVNFEGCSPDDVPRAKRNEVLISAQMKDADSVTKAADFFLQGAIGGTAIARYGWRNLTAKTRVRRLEQVAPGLSVPVVHEYMAEMFNGPVWNVVDRQDFWQQPYKTRIPDMSWGIHRYYADLDDLLEDANSPFPYFDRSGVMQLKDHPISGSASDDYTARIVANRGGVQPQGQGQPRFEKPVEIWEMHGLVPDEFAKNGVRWRCIAIGNRSVVLKNREGPMGSRVMPFLAYSSMPDPYSFDGIGKAEVAFGPQRTADRLSNQKLDALDLLIDPMYVASSGANLNTNNLYSRAGRIMLVEGAVDESNIRALTPDMRGLQAAYAEVGQLYEFMQLGTGDNEILMGGAGGSRETARGFMGRQENALNRLAMETTLAAEGFIEPLANAFRKMNQLWLPLPHQVKILGTMANTDPITGLPYGSEEVNIDYDDLAPDYRARATAASQMAGKASKQQNLVALLQMMSANPALMQVVNWANFARQAFDLFDFKNVNELLVSQVPQVNQMAQQTGQDPNQVASTLSQPMGQLDPQVLAQFMGSQNQAPLQNATFQ
jgi:hypothetical protein